MITANTTRTLSLLRNNGTRLLAVVVVVAAVEVANDYVDLERAALSIAAVALLVTALSIFLVFRLNEAYARWWEARTLWGSIVNGSRSFARQVTTLIAADPAVHRELVYRQIAWVNALRLTLRCEKEWEELRPLLPEGELESLTSAASKPTQLFQKQGERLAELGAAGQLSELSHVMIDGTLTGLYEAQGGCERIKNTPFPDRVSAFTHSVAWGLAIFIPLSILDKSNYFDLIDMIVVPVMMMAFLITKQLGAELRDPFENLANDTPMTALCRSIEIDLRQQLGEREVPPPIQPVDGVLM
jgi:putative membrane protein